MAVDDQLRTLMSEVTGNFPICLHLSTNLTARVKNSAAVYSLVQKGITFVLYSNGLIKSTGSNYETDKSNLKWKFVGEKYSHSLDHEDRASVPLGSTGGGKQVVDFLVHRKVVPESGMKGSSTSMHYSTTGTDMADPATSGRMTLDVGRMGRFVHNLRG